MTPCPACLRRRWLLGRLAPHLEKARSHIDELLVLEDAELIKAVGGRNATRLADELDGLGEEELSTVLAGVREAGLAMVCLHEDDYPGELRALEAPPVLSVNGGVQRLAQLCGAETVAIVGTRRPSEYGTDAAMAMAHGLAASGVTVISGMALGIDSKAHEGALLGGGRTIAVLAGSAAQATPRSRRKLFDRVLGDGVVISEHGPGTGVWRWALQARNRIIAGLATVTVLIEGPERSGAMITVRHADRLRRPIGVLPGQVGVPQAAGPNLLLAKARAGTRELQSGGVIAVRDAQDVLDLIYGEGMIEICAEQLRTPPSSREQALLARIGSGAVANVAMLGPEEVTLLTGLEIKHWVRRGAGGALVLRAG